MMLRIKMVRKTKIIATIGPSSDNLNTIYRLAKEGVDAFRLNFSHGTLEEKARTIEIIRSIEAKIGKYLPIIGDLRGPMVRIGEVTSFKVVKGDAIKLKLGNKGDASKREVPVPIEKFFSELEEGDIIFVGGGRLRLNIREVRVEEALCIAMDDGTIEGGKTLAVKGKELDLPILSEKDLRDIEFSIDKGLDYLAISFVRKRDDIVTLKGILKDRGGEKIRIIAKVETKSAVRNLDEIVEESDAVLVARGDLGMHFSLEKVPRLQNEIISKCVTRGKPVILATQLLESMVERPIPTRSEVVDVMTAVQSGVDSLLLADETAVGKYPIEAVQWLRRIILEGEKDLSVRVEGRGETIYDKFAKGITFLADSINAKIVAFSRRGATAGRLSRYRPRAPIYVVTNDIVTARQISLLWGVYPYFVEGVDYREGFSKLIRLLKEKGYLSYGDIVIYTIGLREGSTDTVKIEVIK